MDQKKIIRVATFNALNLILPDVTYYDNRKYSVKDFEKKIDWIANMLKNMNADIVGFQEVFQKEALELAVERSGIYKDANIIVANQNDQLPRVAVLSRFPIENFSIFEDFPPEAVLDVEERDTNNRILMPYKSFSRPVLKAEINIHKGFTLNFYVVHLKSKRPIILDDENRYNPVHLAKGQARSLIIRASEAVALRCLLSKDLVNTETPVILTGDVNDGGHSVTTVMVSGETPQRRLPQNVKRQIWDSLLYHVKDLQARRSFSDFYYTHIHNGHYDSLDHIMVSQELVSENPNHIGRVGYVSLFNDHIYDQTLSNEKPKNWKSDHGQVSVTIELNISRIESKLGIVSLKL